MAEVRRGVAEKARAKEEAYQRFIESLAPQFRPPQLDSEARVRGGALSEPLRQLVVHRRVKELAERPTEPAVKLLRPPTEAEAVKRASEVEESIQVMLTSIRDQLSAGDLSRGTTEVARSMERRIGAAAWQLNADQLASLAVDVEAIAQDLAEALAEHPDSVAEKSKAFDISRALKASLLKSLLLLTLCAQVADRPAVERHAVMPSFRKEVRALSRASYSPNDVLEALERAVTRADARAARVTPARPPAGDDDDAAAEGADAARELDFATPGDEEDAADDDDTAESALPEDVTLADLRAMSRDQLLRFAERAGLDYHPRPVSSVDVIARGIWNRLPKE